MNRNDLSVKWSKYCDTDKLVTDAMALFKKYRHNYSEKGICILLDTYFTQKEPLIKLLSQSKNYMGDMRIALKKEFDRQISRDEIRQFFYGVDDRLHLSQLLQFADADGKVMLDYLKTDKTSFDIDDLPDKKEQEVKKKNLSKFNYADMSTTESNAQYIECKNYISYFANVCYSKIHNDIVYSTSKDAPTFKAGTKTSRAFNKVCQHYGVDKLSPETVIVEKDGVSIEKTIYPYDKVFAEYADLVSDLARKMYFIISVNPLDYLTMSFGVSWKSCHNINGGGWQGGCLSYMLDKTSIVTYVINNMDEPIHEIPKFYRQMFHYDNYLFIQNRLYPQGNDGATDLYAKFRGFMTEEFSKLLNIDGEWKSETGSTVCCNHIDSKGSHYRDYTSRNDCTMFYPASHGVKANHMITIGHEGRCLRCGKPFTASSYLSHTNRFECVI